MAATGHFPERAKMRGLFHLGNYTYTAGGPNKLFYLLSYAVTRGFDIIGYTGVMVNDFCARTEMQLLSLTVFYDLVYW